MSVSIPESDVDLFSDDFLADPYPQYARMRAQGPVVRMLKHGVLAVTTYAAAREVLRDHQTFVSGQGVGFNPSINQIRASSVIGSDPPRHGVLRSVLTERLGPRALRGIEDTTASKAVELVKQICEQPEVDAVTGFAEIFPVDIVGELVGLPRDARGELLTWANGAFNAFGEISERTRAGLEAIEEQFDYVRRVAVRERLTPGSMGAAVYEAADRGVIPEEYCAHLLSAYLTAGMDTTVNAIGALVLLFGSHPEQWHELRKVPAPVPLGSVISEVLRLASPVQVFSRVAIKDAEIAGRSVSAGERVAVLYGCANRDETQYPDPDRFDMYRNPAAHLAFGSGIHACAGQALALIELRSILQALRRHVDEIRVGEPVFKVNNVLRGLAHLPATFIPATDQRD